MERIFSNCRGSLGSLLKIASNPFRSSSAFAMLVGCVSSDPKKGRTNSVQKQLIKPLLNEKDGPVFKMADDPRITRVGHFIRKTSIDELPQFLNVLFGQIPLRILKTRPEFSEESMSARAFAKSSTNKGKVFSQVVSCFVSGLRTRCISNCNWNRIGGPETQFLAKLVFMEVRA